ncbi:MAG TPA: response regulator [Roseiflexaceae bacterium]|jgi:two-component system cell cycle response regulator DivK|nr:response regulator [Roseiflexaceae bacterium]
MSIDPKTATVIVVEDNADNLFIVMDLLREDLGVRYCNGRASGRQFFKLIETNPQSVPDLILLDIQIPYEDGYAVLRQIRTMPALNATKVVAVTANVLPQDVERVRQAGFDGFIGKPIDADRFPEQITRVLGGTAVWEPH